MMNQVDNKFKRSFILKQITPLIHFQYSEDGASIRGTELKPKFDKFIRAIATAPDRNNVFVKYKNVFPNYERLCENLERINSGVNSNYYIKKTRALNYKVRISTGINQKELEKSKLKEKNKTIGAYFDIDGSNSIENDKGGSFFNEVRVSFICFEQELLQVIEEIFPLFIAVNNFGFRQDKGYGGFICSNNISESTFFKRIQGIKILKEMFNGRYEIYQLNDYQNKRKQDKFRQALIEINDFNHKLKSGKNNQSSYIVQYWNNRKYMNEKDAMKLAISSVNELEGAEIREDSIVEDKRYIRGVFGFADHYEFRHIYFNDGMKNRIKIAINFKLNSNIKRFPSPLNYIVEDQGSSVYIVLDKNALKSIQGLDENSRKIELVAELGKNRDLERKPSLKKHIEQAVQKITPVELYVPTTDEFDVVEFFEILIKERRIRAVDGGK